MKMTLSIEMSSSVKAIPGCGKSSDYACGISARHG